MEFIIIILLIVILVVIFLNKNNNIDIVQKLNNFELNLVKELNEFQLKFSKNVTEDFHKLNNNIEERLRFITNVVNERLDENFEKTNKTFISVLERLSKIDEAQKKIDVLSGDIISLQNVLTDKKSRGIFGEVNLTNIMSNVFGEKNDKIYKLQYLFKTGVQADCVLFAPEPLGAIVIDSKFPLENYQAMVNKKNPKEIRLNAEKAFKADIKKHIDDIAHKYIIPGITNDQAIMFLPAEAIFAEINAYHPDLVNYSYKKKVWLTSPTTLISTLTTIQIIIKNIERDKYASVIHDELKLLDIEFKRYKERWDKLARTIDTVNRDVKDIHITTDKINKHFEEISSVEIKKIDYEKNK